MTEPRGTKGVVTAALLILLLVLPAGPFYSNWFDRSNQADTRIQSEAIEKPGGPKALIGPVGLSLGWSDLPAKETADGPLRIGLEETFRLRKGETAVLSFLRLEPGLNGAVMVTPEMTPDGNVSMNCRILEVTDQAVESMAAKDLFPNFLSTDHSDAIDPLQLELFLDAVKAAEDAKEVALPRIISRPGMKATFRNLIISPDGQWRGVEFSTSADPRVDGGFDLSLNYTWQGDPPE